MEQDVTKGRPTEIDYMNGHVVQQGREAGVPTPVSAATVEMVREIDPGTRKPEAQNIGAALPRAGALDSQNISPPARGTTTRSLARATLAPPLLFSTGRSTSPIRARQGA